MILHLASTLFQCTEANRNSGFCWNMFNVTNDSILFVASWDTSHIEAREANRFCDDMASMLRRLADKDHWDHYLFDFFLP